MRTPATVLVLALAATTPGRAEERYVYDPTIDDELHFVETIWNSTVGDSGDQPDFTGDLSGFTTSYVSPTGDWSVAFAVTDVSYVLNIGELDLEALHPLRRYTCGYTAVIEQIEIGGSGELQIEGPDQQWSLGCTGVRAGIRGIEVQGRITLSPSSIGLAVTSVGLDHGSYYLDLPCTQGENLALSATQAPAGLSTALRKLVLQALKSSDSRFGRICRARIATGLRRALLDLQRSGAIIMP